MFFSLSRVQKEVTEGPETSVLKSPIIRKCSYLSQQLHFCEIGSLSDSIFSILNNFAVALFLKTLHLTTMSLSIKAVRHISSIFVSKFIIISMLEVNSDADASNLFRIKLTFIWAIGDISRDISLFSVVLSEGLTSVFFLWF